ncbi:hypothetical protein K435DRAFT_322733 [Dendrothele bispora CBS 962.96]|uniref:Uncharacterized protein n=1 Tax=Dendrothele bispora (strain CBS 962.96) TaxID=1314807 RepID=A0A4S8MJA7_DENBC|nr:hypothetical protein K435DRAFT_322733 [Dendrothele bispora CBS 962.96]
MFNPWLCHCARDLLKARGVAATFFLCSWFSMSLSVLPQHLTLFTERAFLCPSCSQ